MHADREDDEDDEDESSESSEEDEESEEEEEVVPQIPERLRSGKSGGKIFQNPCHTPSRRRKGRRTSSDGDGV